jgi:hypothetical protein
MNNKTTTYIQQLYQEEQLRLIEEKWNSFDEYEKVIVVEMLKALHPNKTKLINESKWYNTLGDIVGIFDPTGIVDIVNGISYWRQGDKLYAILSFISAIPGLGDVIAKPVVGILKMGGQGVKAFRAATIAGDAVKIGETAAKMGGPINKLVQTSPKWGEKLIAGLYASIGRVPLLGKRTVKLIEEFINLFINGSKTMKSSEEMLKMAAKAGEGLSMAEKASVMEKLAKESRFTGFRNFGTGKNSYMKYMASDASLWQKLNAGMPRLFGGNPATRSLMRRTKWYFGLLSTLGFNDYVDPEELVKQTPNIEQKISEYNKTPQAQSYFASDFGDTQMGGQQPTQQPQQTTQSTNNKIMGKDPFEMLLGSIFM